MTNWSVKLRPFQGTCKLPPSTHSVAFASSGASKGCQLWGRANAEAQSPQLTGSQFVQLPVQPRAAAELSQHFPAFLHVLRSPMAAARRTLRETWSSDKQITPSSSSQQEGSVSRRKSSPWGSSALTASMMHFKKFPFKCFNKKCHKCLHGRKSHI